MELSNKSRRKPIFGAKNDRPNSHMYNTSPNLYRTNIFKMQDSTFHNLNHQSNIVYSPRNGGQQPMYQSVMSPKSSQPLTIKINSPINIPQRNVTPPPKITITPMGRPAYSISKYPQNPSPSIIVRPAS